MPRRSEAEWAGVIVVDTNVIAYLLIEGEKTQLAQQAYHQDSAWLVPGLKIGSCYAFFLMLRIH